MEFITSIALLSIFFFLYFFGRTKNDFILEILGNIGIMILGILIFGTGLQMMSNNASSETITLGTNNITMENTKTEVQDIIGANVFGIIIIFISIITSMLTWKAIAMEREKLSRGDE